MEQLERPLGASPRLRHLGARASDAENLLAKGRSGGKREARHYVVERREPLEKPEVLERPRDSECGEAGRRRTLVRAPVDEYAPAIWSVDAGDHID